ncbi:calmodulin-binding transcription activator 1 isoform X4 [Bradysia coprophila]|uniref:calmodulin-binding transcription activator 1 isoform X4 n=1 Tax=Bradysia coprophila TaxID=38358 RepID=UPI00187DB504|nr:calmodulin-binding transcription activator 1 isoform X4 [Bradysia coprophila]
MTSQAVYCLSLQIRPTSEENSDTTSNETSRNASVCSSDKQAKESLDGTSQKTMVPIQQQQSQPQIATTQSLTQHHNNIILVRGSRNENGQIILQNSHELLNLLNDEDKPILLQHPRFKTSKQQSEGAILLQPTIKGSHIDGPVLLQSTNVKKSTTLPEGSIIVQQRLNKNGTADGPILLQTLKRLDKSQSILVFRNANSSTATASLTSNTTTSRIKHFTDDAEEKKSEPIPVPKAINIPLGSDGEPISLADNLESLPRADHFPTQRHRWNTNEEIAAILISFDKHSEWQSKEVRTRPKSGSMLLYSRKKVRYRRDGYCWKKRKDGKTTREDHMKLKVQGTECIYGCYVHSAILPTFHRRCYWLLQNPDIVLVHYLNVPYPDDNKMAVITPSLALWGDKKEWTKEELVSQLKPMFFSEDEPDANNEIEISKFQTAETVEAIVSQLMEKQRLARQAALVKQLECGCPDSTCADGKSCSHPMRRITAKTTNEKRQENNNQVSSTTPNVLIGSRLYSRWVDRRGRDQLTEITNPSTANGPIHFQVIPTSSQTHTISNQLITRTNSNMTNSNNSSINPTNNHQLSNTTNSTNHINISNRNHTGGSGNNQMTINTSHNQNISNNNGNGQMSAVVSHSNQISLTCSSNSNFNITNNDGHISMTTTASNQNQQQHQQSIIDSGNVVNHRSNVISGNNNRMGSTPIVTSAPPLVLSLSQIQGTNGSLLILNGQQQSFVCQTQQNHQLQQQNSQQRKQKDDNKMLSQSSITPNLIPKQEIMESSSSMSSAKMDHNYENMSYSSTQQNTPIPSPAKSNANPGNRSKDMHDTMPFFNETLELSQEDIQKTLSANMPLGGHNVETIGGEINPMDFINNYDVGSVGKYPELNRCGRLLESNHFEGAGPSVNDDDVFVNLDAFDMFVEFPDLVELDSKNHFLSASETTEQNSGDKVSNENSNCTNVQNNESHQEICNISDYSPEWAYTEGGVKVLVTGPWDSNSNYTVLFDAFPVPTTIVQCGVLRCYCPAHEVGLATLQVACDGYVISNSVIFEYKLPPNVETACEGSANDSLYKLSLYNRLESIDERLQIKTEPKDASDDTLQLNQPNFEERLVNYCQMLTSKQWRSMTPGSWTSGYKGMTLLHLASALGYAKLVGTMLTWRADNPSIILETEIDALSQDNMGYTPLMWSCARGHQETATILYKWNYDALNIKNRSQQTPVEVAKINGFKGLAIELERLDLHRNQSNQSLSYHLNSINKSNLTNQSLQNHNYAYNSSNSRCTKSINAATNSILYTQSYSSASSPTSNKDNNNELCSNNGNNNGIDAESSLCSSPLSMGSVTSLNSNRSHDGVFLRPGAVSSSQSPPAARLTKRPSVDSGINMDVRTASRSGKIIREQQLKLTRFDRSMSLPVSNSPISFATSDTIDTFSISIDSAMEGSSFNSTANTSISNISLLSPLRKMDFALCEVSAENSSPIMDQPSISDDEDSRHPDNDMTEGGVVGESDAKVLTLAEQIIAAMPERIKNESVEMMSLGSPISESLNVDTPSISVLNDTFMEPLLDSLPSSNFDQEFNSEFNFEFSDHNYRYHDVGTPCSSLSPASSGPLQSPASYSVQPDPPMSSPSPPPTTEDFTEFLQASSAMLKPFEADFSNLTLSDLEQRELYEAAKCIQKAYRSYKGRKKLEEQDKERSAAIIIQNYYRRYKQYAYYRQMTHAALVIQNGYRSYCENKRFKKSQNQSSSTVTTQDSQFTNYYKHYQHEQHQPNSGTTSKEPSPSGPLKRTYSQRTQNQAARKIQQFMRQSKMNLWDEHMRTLTAERASRKREAGPPTPSGVPPKLVSRSTRASVQRSK